VLIRREGAWVRIGRLKVVARLRLRWVCLLWHHQHGDALEAGADCWCEIRIAPFHTAWRSEHWWGWVIHWRFDPSAEGSYREFEKRRSG
jgi:hypothetical protein